MNKHVEALAEAGAHFVLTKGKVATQKAWQKHKPDALQAERWLAGDGQKLGLVPGSLGLIVIDIDKKSGALPADEVTAIEAKFGTALANVETPSGGRHLFYRSAEDHFGNKKWRSGDIRHSTGYVALYDIGAVRSAVDKIAGGAPLEAAAFLQAFGVPEPNRADELPARTDDWHPGRRNDTLFRKAMIAGIHDSAAEFDAAKAAAVKAGLDDKEIKQTARNGWKTGVAARERGTMQARDATNFAAIAEAMGWEFRHNERSAQQEIRHKVYPDFSKVPGWCNWSDWEPLSDLWWSKIADDTESNYHVATDTKKGKARFKGANADFARWIQAIVFDRKVDPFLEHLYRLPGSGWDGVERLPTLLCELFGAADDPLTRWGGIYPVLGAIQRTLDPGCKLDEMLVIYGPQGIGKSAFPAALLGNDDWFRDGLNLAGSDKEQIEAMGSAVIVEIAELTGAHRAHTDRLKAFLTRRVEHARLAYGHTTTHLPRRCIFIGTADRSEMLPDDSAGNRRFVVVECPKGSNIEAYMAKNRAQLWAEGNQRHDRGERANLPRELAAAQASRNRGHRTGNEYLEGIVERLAPTDALAGASLADLVDEAKTPASITQKQFATALTQKGWQNQRLTRDGKQGRRWFSPDGWKPAEAPM